MGIREPELGGRNILNSRRRMAGNIQHLHPIVVGWINRRDARLHHARQSPDSVRKLIAKARDCPCIRIAHAGQIKMPRQQMVLTDSQLLPLQAQNALNQQACPHQKHQGHRHFRDDQDLRITCARGPAVGEREPSFRAFTGSNPAPVRAGPRPKTKLVTRDTATVNIKHSPINPYRSELWHVLRMHPAQTRDSKPCQNQSNPAADQRQQQCLGE